MNEGLEKAIEKCKLEEKQYLQQIDFLQQKRDAIFKIRQILEEELRYAQNHVPIKKGA